MVEKTLPEVNWNKRAYSFLQKAYETIKEHSPANAEKVRQHILSITRELPKTQEDIPLINSKRITQEITALLKNTPTESPTNIRKKKLGYCGSDMSSRNQRDIDYGISINTWF